MGLDVRVEENLRPYEGEVKTETDDWWDVVEQERLVHVWVDNGFEHALGDLKPGWYHSSGCNYEFRAGSYSGYGSFRDALSIAALDVHADTVWHNRDVYRGREFWELINFSDCEGTIGPEVSAKLAADFRSHRDRVVKQWNGGSPVSEYFREKYDAWMHAFELAAETNGAVVFC